MSKTSEAMKQGKIVAIMVLLSDTYKKESGCYAIVEKGLYKLAYFELDSLYLMLLTMHQRS